MTAELRDPVGRGHHDERMAAHRALLVQIQGPHGALGQGRAVVDDRGPDCDRAPRGSGQSNRSTMTSAPVPSASSR